MFNMNQIALKFHWQIIKIKLMKDKTLVCCTDACQLASRWAESGSFPSRTVNSTCSEAFVCLKSKKVLYDTDSSLQSLHLKQIKYLWKYLRKNKPNMSQHNWNQNVFLEGWKNVNSERLTWCACSSTLTRHHHHRRHPHRRRRPQCPFSFSSARRRKKSKFVSTWIWNNFKLMQ